MIKHQTIAVLGGGESGVSAALLAQQNQKEVFLSDYGEIVEKHRETLNYNNIPFEEKGHNFEILKQIDLIITSPGIPEKAKIIQDLRAIGKPIISEVEYASWFFKGKLIAITGSNGKTTTASVLYHVLHGLGEDVEIAGNIGTSFSRVVFDGFVDGVLVLELSSFQLDNIKLLKPDVGILLNITADHLDRYEYKIENYARAKMNLFQNMTEQDLAILNAEDEWTKHFGSEVKARKLYCDARVMKEIETRLKGKHNQFNLNCVCLALEDLGYKQAEIYDQIKTFKAVKHRLETIAFVDQVEYINDSKATNVDAVNYALEGIEKPIVWIAGGVDKGNDYTVLFPLIGQVKALICLGKDNEKLKKSFQDKILDITECQSMADAVKLGKMKARPDDIVLLSPACASFDLFNNYEHRGELFEENVFKLIGSSKN